MIPKTIWQTYKSRKLPAPAREMVRSWRDGNPGYRYRFCDDAQIERFVAAHLDAELVDIFHAMPLNVMRADIWRYAVLYVHGGVYTDLDTVCRTPLDEWLPDNRGLVAALENEEHFCQWTLAAAPGHGALRAVLELIRERAREGIDTSYAHFVHEHTGPGIWTEALCRYLNQPPGPAGGIQRGTSWRDTDLLLLDGGAFRGRLVEHVFASVVWMDESDYASWTHQTEDLRNRHDLVPARDPHWTIREAGDGVMLFNPWLDRHVSCNRPAALILSLCNGERDESGIASCLASRLDPAPDDLEEQVRETLASLVEQGVVAWSRRSNGGAAGFQPKWTNVAALDDGQLYALIKDSVTGPDAFVPEPALMSRLAGDGTAGHALDFGCGIGRNMRGLVERASGWSVTGYDNPDMLARAAQWLPRVLGDREALRRTRLCADRNTLLATRFDVAFASLVFQHMRTTDILKALRELATITDRLVVVSRVNTDEQEDVMGLLGRSKHWAMAEREDDPPGSCHPGHWAAQFTRRPT